jgi:hypothetical protein
MEGRGAQDNENNDYVVYQRVDVSDEQIKDVELELNAWTDEWIAIVGKEGTTTYTHLMSSGHVVYYLRLCRNYYRYSNQGWDF